MAFDRRLKNMLQKFSTLSSAKKLFYNLLFFRKKTYAEVCGIRKYFYTATPALQSRVQYLGGEKEMLEKFVNFTKPGNVVWDIGAYIGMYSIFCEERIKDDGHIYAFEPEFKTFQSFKKNCKLNNTTNITPLNFALSDSTRKGKIYSSKDDSIAISSLIAEPRLKTHGVSVSLHTGDELVKKDVQMQPNIVKIDVEGFEMSVLKGMKNILQNDECRYLFIEVHPKILKTLNKEPKDIDTFLINAGFSLMYNAERGDELHWIYYE